MSLLATAVQVVVLAQVDGREVTSTQPPRMVDVVVCSAKVLKKSTSV